MTVLIALGVIGASMVALLHFSGAKVDVVPMTASVPVQGSFSAGGTDGMPFQIVTAKKAASQSVAASGSKQVSTSASGKVTIYNTQSKPQKLIASTRFASSAGAIFRIHTAVTVPGGSTQKPGSVTATIYADAPGPSYNVEPTSFTVPGLAGTAQESAVYARSTDPMAGGASGSIPVVDKVAEEGAVAALQGSLATDLAASIEGQTPDGYVLIPGATKVSYRELAPSESSTNGKADIQVEGTIMAIVFPQKSLADGILAKASSSGFEGSGATLGKGTSLTLSDLSAMPASDTDSFTFSLSGTAALVADINQNQIATAVAGKSRSEAQVALTNYPEVKRAILVLRPFWKQHFPEDPSAITVTVTPEP